MVKELIFDYRMLRGNLLDNILFENKMSGYNMQKSISMAIVTSSSIIIISGSNVVKAIDVGDKIMKAFTPLIQALQGLSEPICFLVILGGGLVFAFDKNKGLRLIKQGAFAYLLIQFLPAFLTILKEVGKGMSSAK